MATQKKSENVEIVSTKEPTVIIRLPRIKGQDSKYVSVNERSWMIKRGEDVEVPLCVAEQIRNEEKMLDMIEEYEERSQRF